MAIKLDLKYKQIPCVENVLQYYVYFEHIHGNNEIKTLTMSKYDSYPEVMNCILYYYIYNKLTNQQANDIVINEEMFANASLEFCPTVTNSHFSYFNFLKWISETLVLDKEHYFKFAKINIKEIIYYEDVTVIGKKFDVTIKEKFVDIDHIGLH